MPRKPATSQAQHLRLGEYHPHFGGHYAGLIRGRDGQPDYHLFIAPKDRGQAAGLPWCGAGHKVPDAEHTDDGQANTAALLKDSKPHPAAQFCAGLTIDGHSDYYLPSREELRLAFVNCREVFDQTWYWSSTQYAGSAYNAWSHYFFDGGQGSFHKAW